MFLKFCLLLLNEKMLIQYPPDIRQKPKMPCQKSKELCPYLFLIRQALAHICQKKLPPARRVHPPGKRAVNCLHLLHPDICLCLCLLRLSALLCTCILHCRLIGPAKPFKSLRIVFRIVLCKQLSVSLPDTCLIPGRLCSQYVKCLFMIHISLLLSLMFRKGSVPSQLP